MEELKAENEYLRELCSRQEAIITAFQKELPNVEIPEKAEEASSDWMLQEYMSPLLLAYDRKINNLKSQNKECLEEIEHLHKLLNVTETAPQPLSIMNRLMPSDANPSSEHIHILREQNDIMRQNHAELSERCKKLESQLEQADEELEEAVARLKAEGEYREQCAEIVKTYPTLAQKLEESTSLVEMYGKKVSSLTQELSESKLHESEAVAQIESRLQQIREKLIVAEAKLAEAESTSQSNGIRIQSFERSNAIYKKSNESLLQEKKNLESQIESMMKCLKEKAELIRECTEREKELMEKIETFAQNESEATSKLKQVEHQVLLLKQSHKTSEEDQEVRHRKELQQKEDAIGELTNEYLGAEKAFKDEILKLQENLSKQTVECELHKRLLKTLEQESHDQIRARTEEYVDMKERITTLKTNLQSAEFKRNTAVEQLNRLTETMKATEKIRDQERDEIELQIVSIREQKEKDGALLTEARNMIEEMETRNLDSEKRVAEMRQQLRKSKTQTDSQIQALESQWRAKCRACQQERQKIKEMYLENEEKIAKLIETQSEIGEKWKDENRTLLVNFQRRSREMKVQNSELLRKLTDVENRELELRNQTSQTKLQLETTLHEKEKIESTYERKQVEFDRLLKEIAFRRETEERVMTENQNLRQGLNYCELELKSCQRKLNLLEQRKTD